MIEKQALLGIFTRVSTFRKIYFYNKKIVDPYYLASHGLLITQRQINNHQNNQSLATLTVDFATCQNQNCLLSIQFDQPSKESQSKIQLSQLINDHQQNCNFKLSKLQPSSILDANIIYNFGKDFYDEAIKSFQQNNVFVELQSSEVKQILGIDKYNSQNQFNFNLQLFKHLDSNLQTPFLSKIKPSIYLSTLGWRISKNQNNIYLTCLFCGIIAQVNDYVIHINSCTLETREGFQFVSFHRPWCCIVNNKTQLWKQILKKTIYSKLSNLQGQIIKTQNQKKCKQLKDKAIKIYQNYYQRIINSKRQIGDLREQSKKIWRDDKTNEAVKRSYDEAFKHLQNNIQNGREIVETFIKKIKIN